MQRRGSILRYGVLAFIALILAACSPQTPQAAGEAAPPVAEAPTDQAPEAPPTEAPPAEAGQVPPTDPATAPPTATDPATAGVEAPQSRPPAPPPTAPRPTQSAAPSTDGAPAAANGSATRGLQRQNAAEFQLPSFPWPPPAPSARYAVPRADVVAGLGANPTLAAVGRRLTDALAEADYSEYSFYSAPGGFALVARLERIEADGTPAPDSFRFLSPNSREPFSLSAYVQRLFFAPEGFYRMIAFVVNDEAFVASGAALSADEAQALLTRGADRLPPSFDRRPFGPNHRVSALIYEFRKGPQDRDVETLVPGRITGRVHLERAGIDLGAN